MMRKKIFKHLLINTFILLIVLLCTLFFFVMLINSTKSQTQLLKPFSPVPGTAGISNLKKALSDSTIPILYGILNSMIVSGGAAILAVYVSVAAAYGIYTYNFFARKALFTIIMMILVMPAQTFTLGLLRIISGIGLTDNLLALILPAAVSPSVFYFLYSYMKVHLDREFLDAARIDGAGEWRIFNRLVIPVMHPAMAVQGIFVFISSWNNYFFPSLVMETKRRRTLPVMLADIRTADFANKDMGKIYMMITLSVIPILLAYILLSREILDGASLQPFEEDE